MRTVLQQNLTRFTWVTATTMAEATASPNMRPAKDAHVYEQTLVSVKTKTFQDNFYLSVTKSRCPLFTGSFRLRVGAKQYSVTPDPCFFFVGE